MVTGKIKTGHPVSARFPTTISRSFQSQIPVRNLLDSRIAND